jgi:hypothetical protein
METLIVGERGQITIPINLGLNKGVRFIYSRTPDCIRDAIYLFNKEKLLIAKIINDLLTG